MNVVSDDPVFLCHKHRITPNALRQQRRNTSYARIVKTSPEPQRRDDQVVVMKVFEKVLHLVTVAEHLHTAAIGEFQNLCFSTFIPNVHIDGCSTSIQH